jgi:hypothetical protein
MCLEAVRLVVAMLLYVWRLGRFSNFKPGMVPASRRILSVGILRWLISSASGGQWLNFVIILWTRAWAVKPLSEFFSWRLLDVRFLFGLPCP